MGYQFVLSEFKQISEESDNSRNYNFFLAMIGLCSSLCLGRNYLAMDQLVSIYPFNLCHNVMSSSKYDLGLRRRMIRLVIHLWVDKAPHTKLVLPDRIRIWGEIEKRDDTSILST